MLKFPACLGLLLVLAACVAPEAPPVVRSAPSPSVRPTSNATFEDAPLPNRKMGAPINDSIIRMGK